MKILACCILLISAAICRSGNENDKVETFELKYGDTLEYDLGFLGDEDKAKIIIQPRYNLLEGFCSKNREPLIYCYSPAKNFQTDTIQFKLSTGSDGANPNTDHNFKTLIIKNKIP